MTVPDYPPGEWSALLVGPQWVSGTTLTIITNALANRKAIVTNFSNLYETLQSALNATLPGQKGVTADAIRDAFHQGADQAFHIAEKNEAYAKVLQRAHNDVIVLRHLLTGIAEKGNKEINDAQSSKADFATKTAKIAEVIAECQREANQRAAACAEDIMSMGEDVFAAQGTGQSFHGLAHANGIDNVNRQPDLNAIEDQVRGKLNQPATQALMGENPLAPPDAAAPAAASVPGAMPGSGGNIPAGLTAPPGAAPPAAASVPRAMPGSGGNIPAGLNAPAAAVGSAPHASAPSVNAPQVSAPSMGAAPSAPATGMPAGLAPANPSNVASAVNTGVPGAAPAGATGLPAGPVQAMEPQLPPAPPTYPAAGTGTPVAVGDVPPPVQQPPAPPIAPSPAYTPETSSPMVAGPAAGPVAAPSAPAGPLPAYGADLRPPVAASAPASPPAAPVSQPPVSQPPPTVSGSPPVHPSAGQAGVGQPAMVRQPAPPTPSPSPPGIGTQGVMAAAGGALAGAVSADATARARLQRLVAAVAHQQPRLAWAVGDRPDDTTILVTDLASGWIPPGVDIPAAVTLLEPARRRGDLEALLGEVKLAATYTPGHYRPDPDADEPVPTSLRPRRAPDIEELSWQLSHATHWRDGLPRLAHTLAKAASRETGVLDSEADQLHDELTKLADRVLDSYPDAVDGNEVGNWQLLAAIDALVTRDKTAANYHLAWFLACNTAAAEDVAR